MREKDDRRPQVNRMALCHFCVIGDFSSTSLETPLTGQAPILIPQIQSGPHSDSLEILRE